MKLNSNGECDPGVMRAYRFGLDYLSTKGFDVIIKSELGQGNLMDMIDRMGGKETNPALSIPYKKGEESLSKELMNLFEIKTKKDLGKYLRIVSIILLNFTGPENYDHLNYHVGNLRNLFEKEPIYHANEEDHIIYALRLYEQLIGKRIEHHKVLSEKEYQSFARILNLEFNLYNPDNRLNADIFALENMTDERFLEKLKNDKLRPSLFKTLKHYKITEINTIEEFYQLKDKPIKREKLLDDILKWLKKVRKGELGPTQKMFKLLYCNLTDETLIQKTATQQGAKALLNYIKLYRLLKINTETELQSYVKNQQNRVILLKKIKDYCEKYLS